MKEIISKEEFDALKKEVTKMREEQHDREVIKAFVKTRVAKPLVWVLEKLLMPVVVAATVAWILK